MTTGKEVEFQIWSCTSGVHLKTISEDRLEVKSLAFHPYLQIFASISSNHVMIFGSKAALHADGEKNNLLPSLYASEEDSVLFDENQSSTSNRFESHVDMDKKTNEDISIRALSKSHPAAFAIAKFLNGWPKKKRLAFSTAGFYLLDQNIIYEEREDEFDEPIQENLGLANETVPSQLDNNLKTYLGLNEKNWPNITREFLISTKVNDEISVLSMFQMTRLKHRGYLSAKPIETSNF